MRHILDRWQCTTLLVAWLASTVANANVVIANTRAIFPSDQSEITVKLSNDGATASLVQAWVDDGRPQAQIEDLQVPFSVMPVLFRLDPGKGQSLRLFHTGEALPADRESLYWLNVLDVPPKGSGNRLQIALRSRIKLLYRPAGLPGDAARAHRALTWQLERDGDAWVLIARNPGPYVVNLASLSLRQPGLTAIDLQPAHVLPFASTRFHVAGLQGIALPRLQYAFIDDYGAVRKSPEAVDVPMPH